MTIALASLPLALLAGALSILSPCVWPLVPIVMASASVAGRGGALFLALGLSLSFALAGTLLSFLLLSAGLDTEILRSIAAWALVLAGVTLVVDALGAALTRVLSLGVARIAGGASQDGAGARGGAAQFGVGALLGLVWLPCVGPTLGAAIALASVGESLAMAFLVMALFGIGNAATLVLAGLASRSLLMRLRPGFMRGGALGKRALGVLLVLLGMLVLFGADKTLEVWALDVVPDWATTL